MQYIEIRDLIKYYIKNIMIIIGLTFIFFISSFVYFKSIYIPKFKSSVTVLIMDVYDLNDDENYFANKDLTQACTRIIKSNNLISTVIEKLNLDYKSSELNNNIEVESINKAELIKISVTDTNSDNSELIAKELASTFVEKMKDIYNFNNMKIVDNTEGTLLENNFYNKLLKYTFVGFMFGLLIVLIKFYSDCSIKKDSDVEELGLNLLGVITSNNKANDFNLIKTIIDYNSISKKNVLFINETNDMAISMGIGNSYLNDNKKVLIINFDKELVVDNYDEKKEINGITFISYGCSLKINQVEKMLKKYNKCFDVVLINTTSLSYSLLLSKIINNIVVTAKFNKTSIKLLSQIKINFEKVGINNLNVILDKNDRDIIKL